MFNVRELYGAALDCLVAKGEGVTEETFLLFYDSENLSDDVFHYSTDWMHGYSIIEKYGISVLRVNAIINNGVTMEWAATTGHQSKQDNVYVLDDLELVYGETLLIAAMRCYCVMKYGETVEFSDDFLERYPPV